MVVLLIKIEKSGRKKNGFRGKIKMSVLDMSCLRCPFDIIEVMCNNYLSLCCEILKGILFIFVSPELHFGCSTLPAQFL